MTLNEWEQSNIELLTSREMGEWLSRRENRLLEQIRDEIEGLMSHDDYMVDGFNVLDIIDKYKGDKE